MAKKGDQIGPYILEQRLGAGAFKEVWLASKTNKFGTSYVALGVLRGDVDEAALIKEAEIWRSIPSHPNVNKLIDVEDFGGQVVILSDYVEGGTLAKYLDERAGAPVEEKNALSLIRSILLGLHHLHTNNPPIVHRDLKPGNVLMRGDSPVLTDFGLARWTDDSMTLNVAGTPAYMAPEMFDRQYSAQSDIWAVGVMLHRIVSGEIPFGNASMSFVALADRIRADSPKPLPSTVSAATQRIVTHALEKVPANRYASAQEMLNAVEGALHRAAPAGTITTLFTDIVGSTEMKRGMLAQAQAQRDSLYNSRIKQPHDRLVCALVDRYEGFVAKDTGDGFLITFTNVESAILCAVAINNAISEARIETPSGALQIRMGLNTGHVEYRNGDYIGAVVDKAARVQANAQPGQVAVSRETYELVSGKLNGIDFARSEAIQLKGVGLDTVYIASTRKEVVSRPVVEPVRPTVTMNPVKKARLFVAAILIVTLIIAFGVVQVCVWIENRKKEPIVKGESLAPNHTAAAPPNSVSGMAIPMDTRLKSSPPGNSTDSAAAKSDADDTHLKPTVQSPLTKDSPDSPGSGP